MGKGLPQSGSALNEGDLGFIDYAAIQYDAVRRAPKL